MDLSYYSPGTIFCFHSEKKPPVANYSFSIPDGGGGQRWKVWYKMQQKHIDVILSWITVRFQLFRLRIKSSRVPLLSKLFSRNYLRITGLKRKETITKAEREHNFCKKVMLILFLCSCRTYDVIPRSQIFGCLQSFNLNILDSFIDDNINWGPFTILLCISLKAFGWLMGWLTK